MQLFYDNDIYDNLPDISVVLNDRFTFSGKESVRLLEWSTERYDLYLASMVSCIKASPKRKNGN